MVDRYSFHLENAAGEDLGEVLEQFCLEYYGSAPSIPPQILVPRGVGRHVARSRRSCRSGAASRVEVRAPERGEKRRLQELAQQNAQLALESETFVAETKRARRVEALEELREALNLESLPIRIECFDISNIQGQEIVGSMVVFEDGVAKKGALPQVRGARRRGPGRLRGDARGDRAPLLAARRRAGVGRVERVVRGDAEPRRDRRRQGAAGGRARGDAGARPAARRGDRAREADRGGVRARPRRADPAAARARRRCSSCSGSATRRTASRSRSTASAATPPRASRCSTSSRASGPARRRALLQHFGSAERVVAATQEELEGVPGVPAKTARRIYAQLHRAGARVAARSGHGARRVASPAPSRGQPPRTLPLVRAPAPGVRPANSSSLFSAVSVSDPTTPGRRNGVGRSTDALFAIT